jgi:hypothetical protein
MLYLITHRAFLGEAVFKLTGSRLYANYITRDAESRGSMINIIIKALPIIIICILGLKGNTNVIVRYKIYFAMMICGYMFTLIAAVTATAVDRLGYYFTYLNIVLCSFACRQGISFGNIRISCHTTKYIVCLYMLIMFLLNVVFRNYGEVIPYQGIFDR